VNNFYLDTECGINRVAVRSTLTPGTIMLTATPTALAAGARASARFNVHHGEALEMFIRLLIRTVKRHECRAPQAGGLAAPK